MFDNFVDNDSTEEYPYNGDIEQKAIYSIEQLRRRFYEERKTFVATRPEGDLYHALLTAYGPKTADSYSRQVTLQYQNFISQAYLTEEDETTNPSIPVDKMVNHELRRIRSAIILHVSHFFHQFEEMMPDKLEDWFPATVLYNLGQYPVRYGASLYDDITVVIPNKKMKPPSVADITVFIQDFAINLHYAPHRNAIYGDMSRIAIINSVRDEMIRFILKDLPFNNDRLESKTPLLADEIMNTIPDTVPVVH